jgi:hypothetical protein
LGKETLVYPDRGRRVRLALVGGTGPVRPGAHPQVALDLFRRENGPMDHGDPLPLANEA